jgi:LPS export ABC transporter protein LptC
MWRFSVKIFLIITIVIVVGGIICILTSYRYLFHHEQQIDSSIESHIDIGLKKVHHVAIKSGKKLWDLSSESVQRFNAKNHVSPLTLTMYPHSGKTIELTAGHGTVNDNKNIEIEDNILIKQPPWQFVCDSLIYSYTRHEIIGKNNIAITGCGLTITAKAMFYNLSDDKLTIADSVSLTVTQPTEIDKRHSK